MLQTGRRRCDINVTSLWVSHAIPSFIAARHVSRRPAGSRRVELITVSRVNGAGPGGS